MRENYTVRYKVDIVFCIDVTGSMSPIINMVKGNILKLYGDVMEEMRKKNKKVSGLRVRVIAFRDYGADGENAMMASEFFTLPDEDADLKECVDYFVAEGGGDIPEDGLEALAYAIKSDWVKDGDKRRHVIVLCSDAPANEIGANSEAELYPKGMPKSFEELSAWWGDPYCKGLMEELAKRLVIFAPDNNACECEGQWERIAKHWTNVIFVPNATEGLESVDYQVVLSTIANTI